MIIESMENEVTLSVVIRPCSLSKTQYEKVGLEAPAAPPGLESLIDAVC